MRIQPLFPFCLIRIIAILHNTICLLICLKNYTIGTQRIEVKYAKTYLIGITPRSELNRLVNISYLATLKAAQQMTLTPICISVSERQLLKIKVNQHTSKADYMRTIYDVKNFEPYVQCILDYIRKNLRSLRISGRCRFDVTLRIIEDTNANGNAP